MAASIVTEEERGTFTRTPHPHNGYYAGDFRASRFRDSSLEGFALRAAITSVLR